MKFNRLKASIANNASEQPSVYMAVCAIESMLRDMEEEAGRRVEQLPAGDDMLSAKLVWLCRTLQKIYTARSEDLQRNRGRLEQAMGELQNAEAELGRFAGEEEKLAALLRQKAQTQRELDQAMASKAECVKIQEQVDALEQKLARLRELDMDAERAKLESLRGQIDQLETEQRQLAASLNEEQQNLAAARAARGETEQQLRSRGEEKTRVLQRCTELDSQLRELGDCLRQMEAESQTMDKQLETLKQQKLQLEEELEQKEKKLNDYQNREVDPVMEELKKARIEIEAYEVENSQVLGKLQELKQQRDRIIADIAAAKSKCDETERAIRAKEEERIKAEGRRLAAEKKENELQEKLEGLRDELNTLQTAVAQLEDKQLPDQQRLTEEEQGRHERLQDQLNQLSQGKDQLQEENDKLEAQVGELEKDRALFQKTYDSLVADYKNKSQELQTLEDKIKDLEGKDAVQGYATYKQQLEERIVEMEKISAESAALTEEIGRLDREVAEKRAGFSELTAKRDKRDEVRRELALRLNQLRDALPSNYEEELARTSRRLALLNESQERLSKTLTLIREITGTEPLNEQGSSLLQHTSQAVRSLRDAAASLQADLKNCAESIQWKTGV